MSWNDDRDYYEQEAAKEEFIDEISLQAINEFTNELLRSFYIKEPNVMRPAVDALQEGKSLFELNHYSASLVFFVSSIELFLKATVLKPVVFGLVHNEALAEIIVQHVLGQTGFDRYEKLLAILMSTFANLDLKEISRVNSSAKLLNECTELQKLRNKVIHQGKFCNEIDAEKARQVSIAVYELIVCPMLRALSLDVGERGVIESPRFFNRKNDVPIFTL